MNGTPWIAECLASRACETYCETFVQMADRFTLTAPRCIIGVCAEIGASDGNVRAFIAGIIGAASPITAAWQQGRGCLSASLVALPGELRCASARSCDCRWVLVRRADGRSARRSVVGGDDARERRLRTHDVNRVDLAAEQRNGGQLEAGLTRSRDIEVELIVRSPVGG